MRALRTPLLCHYHRTPSSKARAIDTDNRAKSRSIRYFANQFRARYGEAIANEGSNNTIYHNDFINNDWQIFTIGSTNVWDVGYPSGGNHWSNYAGLDLKSGPHQNQTGSDGIGDTPYVIDDYNRDNYPLMSLIP